MLKAVVVDDDRASATAIAGLLHTLGCEAMVCTDPMEAIALALSSQADLLSLDIAMPGLDGHQVLSLLRSHEHSRRLASLPVIAITGKAQAQDRAASLSMGFAAHIAKPVMLDDLDHALQLSQALRSETMRTRASGDEFLIDELLQSLLTPGQGARLASMAGLALALEGQGMNAIRLALVRAYAGEVDGARAVIVPLQGLALGLGAQGLGELCGRFMAALPRDLDALEVAAVLLRAELDRVIFAIRDRVLV